MRKQITIPMQAFVQQCAFFNGVSTLTSIRQSWGQDPLTPSTPPPCYAALITAANNGNTAANLIPPSGTITASIVNEASGVVRSVFNALGQDILTDPLDNVGITFTNICSKNPELCAEGLSLMCSSVNAETVSRRPLLLKWCGCYLDSSQYQKYESLGVTRQCSPLCNVPQVIPLASVMAGSLSGRQLSPCDQTVCIIDNVSVTIANSLGANNVTLSQVCASTSPDVSASCIMTDDNVIESSRLGGNTLITMGCGDVSVPDQGNSSSSTRNTVTIAVMIISIIAVAIAVLLGIISSIE